MSEFETAEVLEAQIAMLERMESQATRTMLAQATVSKRQLLNFVNQTLEFTKDFIALNQRTINIIRRNPDDQNAMAATAASGQDNISDPNAAPGPAAGLCEENSRPDVGGDAVPPADLRRNDAKP